MNPFNVGHLFPSFFHFLYGNRETKFGDEVDPTIFQDISIFAEVVDQVKNDITFLNSFTIQEGFRPDQVSQILYDTPLHYWTFYLINDNIREQGWPLIRNEFEEYITPSELPNPQDHHHDPRNSSGDAGAW